jgi:hypothetical protein
MLIQNLIRARSAKVFYIKVKNSEVKTVLVLHLDLGESLHAGNTIVANQAGKAYITNTLDIDRNIVAPEELN